VEMHRIARWTRLAIFLSLVFLPSTEYVNEEQIDYRLLTLLMIVIVGWWTSMLGAHSPSTMAAMVTTLQGNSYPPGDAESLT